MSTQIGEILVEAGIIDEDQLRDAVRENVRGEKREMIGETLLRMGVVTERDIARALSLQLNIPFVDLDEVVPEPEAIGQLSVGFCKEHHMIPIYVDRRLVVAMADPLAVQAINDAEFTSGCTVKPVVAAKSRIESAINLHYRLKDALGEMAHSVLVPKYTQTTDEPDQVETDQHKRLSSDMAPNVRLVNGVLMEAIQAGASDVHVEPQEDEVIIRNRVDGLLRESMKLPKWAQGTVISRIKVMSGMDITKRAVPQDGKMSVTIAEKQYDLRVSALPAKHGEKIVIRILDKHGMGLRVGALGLSPEHMSLVQQFARTNEGMILVCGPTGSGKTTTLYSMINSIRDAEKNIVTIEDPVEYQLEGINQVQVKSEVGLTFANVLRSVLRQDPDVVLVGEIRDAETAQIALQAAVTGHLVLSTVHTISSVAAIPRLLQLGAEPYLVASGLRGVIAQRLIRRLCPKCRQRRRTPPEAVRARTLSVDQDTIAMSYEAMGCDQCGGTGYKGRVGIFEMFGVGPQVAELVHRNASESEIRAAAFGSSGMTMFRTGIECIRQRMTSVDEVLRTVPSDEGVASDAESCQKCRSCAKPITPEWELCPYCGEVTSEPEELSGPRVVDFVQDVRPVEHESTAPGHGMARAAFEATDATDLELGAELEGMRILAIGDDQSSLDALVGVFLRNRFVISVATSVQEALRFARRDSPHLIVTAVRNPDTADPHIVEALREGLGSAQVPIIMLSSGRDSRAELRAFAAGCDDFIERPFSEPVILARIVVALRRTYKPAGGRDEGSNGQKRLFPYFHPDEAPGAGLGRLPSVAMATRLVGC